MADSNAQLTPLRRLLRLLSNYRRELRYIVLYAIVAGLISLSLPLGIQAIVGLIGGGAISASWAVLVLFVTGGALFVGLLYLMQLSILEYMQRRIFTEAAVELAIRIPRLNLEALRQQYLPELINRFFDTLTIQKALPKIILDGTAAILQILFSLLLLSFYNSGLVIFLLILLALLTVLLWWTAPVGLQTSLTESKYKYRLAYWLEEVGRVAATFKLGGENNFPLQRADELTMEYLNARIRHWRILMLQFVGNLTFRVTVLAGFLVFGSLLVMEGQLNLGQFVASEILIFFIIESVDKLIRLHETAYDLLTATEKLGQVTDLALDRADGIPVENFAGPQGLTIETRDLHYHFPDMPDTPVLERLNLQVKSGERLAIAGYNGAGKSTLMQIFSLLIQDYQGSVLFNGLPASSLQRRSLQGHIGDLSSQEDIFRGSLLDNITLGRSDLTLQQVLLTAERVGLSTFIRQSPAGLNTELLPAGKNLPRSLVLKILLARAIVSDPQLLLIEDTLSNLPWQDRQQIVEFLTRRTQPWTLVAVTADPLLAAHCDRIVVLQKGTIVFDGPFQALQNTEHYARLFRIYDQTNLP